VDLLPFEDPLKSPDQFVNLMSIGHMLLPRKLSIGSLWRIKRLALGTRHCEWNVLMFCLVGVFCICCVGKVYKADPRKDKNNSGVSKPWNGRCSAEM
jgi:hypothetical protein